MDGWQDLHDFPGYSLFDTGEIMNDFTGKPLRPHINQQGIASIVLYDGNGKGKRLAIALLVAKTFLPPPPAEHFDTPIHLDGDKTNNDARNLMWRPRWFAIQYHKQFHATGNYAAWNEVPIKIVDRDEYFPTALECAMHYGVLVHDLFMGAHNHERIPFGGFEVIFGV